MQAYIIAVRAPYGRYDDKPWPESIPQRVAVLATSRGEALALAAEAVGSLMDDQGFELDGFSVEHIFPIVQAGTTPAASVVE